MSKPIVMEFKNSRAIESFVANYMYECKRCGENHSRNMPCEYNPKYRAWMGKEYERCLEKK